MMVRSISYSAFLSNPATTLDEVATRRQPVRVEREDGAAFVLMPAADFTAMQETAYLCSPENARRLVNALYADRSADREFASSDELGAELRLAR